MITLSIALSEACNLNCTYCNVDKQSKTSIDPILFLQTFKEVREKNPLETIKVDFYGGEPLLHFNKIKYIIESIYDDNLKYFMPTNGLLLDQEKLNYLIKHNVEISLSFDGLWQDINRPQGKNGTFNTYLTKKYFFKTIPNLEIHTMIYSGNYNLLENHLFLIQYGANPKMTVIQDRNVWNSESVELLKSSIDDLFNWYIEDTSRELPNTILHFLKVIILNKAKGIEVKNCSAGFEHLSFSENKLIACNRFKDEPELEALIPEFQEMEKCQNCEIKNYCKKGCLYENIKNNGPIDEICEIFKYFYVKIEYMLKVLKNDEKFKELILKEIKYEFGY